MILSSNVYIYQLASVEPINKHAQRQKCKHRYVFEAKNKMIRVESTSVSHVHLVIAALSICMMALIGTYYQFYELYTMY